MEEVTELIRNAVADGRTITVHGDYDCDGVCSTAILVRALRELGARCDWYIPDRLGDGYGLTIAGVERLAARGTGLLLTADCGITCSGEVAAARAAGMEVIVTDHHEPGERLPDCPILHPRLSRLPVRRALRDGGRLQALGGAPGRRAGGGRPRPGGAGDGRRPGSAAGREPGARSRRPRGRAPGGAGRGCGPCAPRPGSGPSGSTRATWPSGSPRGSTPRAASTAPTPGSS